MICPFHTSFPIDESNAVLLRDEHAYNFIGVRGMLGYYHSVVIRKRQTRQSISAVCMEWALCILFDYHFLNTVSDDVWVYGYVFVVVKMRDDKFVWTIEWMRSTHTDV